MLFAHQNGRERPVTDSSEVDVLQNLACEIGPAVNGIHAPRSLPQAMGAFVTTGAQGACAGRFQQQEQHSPTTMTPGLGQVMMTPTEPSTTPPPSGGAAPTAGRFAIIKASAIPFNLLAPSAIPSRTDPVAPPLPLPPPPTTTGSTPTPTGTHPPGSVTAFSPKLNMWRVAFPIGVAALPLPAITAGFAGALGLGQTTHEEKTPQAAPDPADTQVSETELEKKTGKLPIYKNPLFWAAIAGGVVVLGGGFYFLRRRRRRVAAPAAPAPAAVPKAAYY